MPIKTNFDSAAISYPEVKTPLPSGGWQYREKVKDFPDEITVLPYSWETQGILTTNLTGTEKLKRITAMVVSGLPAGFQVDDLLLTDQYYILAIARSLTYGENYTFGADCDRCGHKEMIAVKVPESLPVRRWEYKNLTEFQKAMTIKLPVVKDSITLKYPSILDEEEISSMNRLARAAKKLDADDEGALLNRIAVHIRSVNNSTPDNFKEVRDYVAKIKGLDMSTLQDAIDDRNCGITYLWDVACDKCGNQYEVKIPIQSHFFRRE